MGVARRWEKMGERPVNKYRISLWCDGNILEPVVVLAAQNSEITQCH